MMQVEIDFINVYGKSEKVNITGKEKKIYKFIIDETLKYLRGVE